MSVLSRFRVGTLLTASFVAVAALSLVVGLIGILNMQRMDEAARVTHESDLAGLSTIKDANIHLLYVGRALRNAMLSTSSERRNEEVASAYRYAQESKALIDKARPMFRSDADQALFTEMDGLWTAYLAATRQVTDAFKTEDLYTARPSTNLLFSLRHHVTAVDEMMMTMTRAKESSAQALYEQNQASYHASFTTMIALVAGAVCAGVVLGLGIARGITRQLGGEPSQVVAAARAMAQGDLALVLTAPSGDDHSIVAALARMRDSLADIVAGVRRNAQSVSTAAEEIALGNQDLSGRTEEQASALEQTASSMEELASTVRQNADNATQANQLALGASEVASKGGAEVREVVETMRGISESSKKIADIIGVIDAIAFQTNILALNAAVEAARAGEQGRGFAVVASEVRNLAQRSANAAKEISALINDSVGRVDQGTALVDRAGQTIADVVSAIGRVTEIVGEISSASREQAAGVAQVGTAVSQMDQTTQQNAALVEESAAAAAAMNKQAAELLSAVAVFRLDGAS